MYRSDVVGSLLRPAYLKAARERHEANQMSESEFKFLEDRAVDEAVELQKSVGLEMLTDGEMRRYAFFGHLMVAVGHAIINPKRLRWAVIVSQAERAGLDASSSPSCTSPAGVTALPPP